MTSNHPEPRPWREICAGSTVENGSLVIGETWMSLGPLRGHDGQLYAQVGDEDLWLEFEHYVYRAAQGELPMIEDVGLPDSFK